MPRLYISSGLAVTVAARAVRRPKKVNETMVKRPSKTCYLVH
jgi:hypothetical protein